MRTILVTVGISLLSNARRDLGEGEPTPQQLANYLRHTDPITASAETNSLSRLLQDGDHIVFLSSHTGQGTACAAALARHYVSDGRQSRVREVQDLTYAESRFKMRGLRSLVAIMIEEIRREKASNRTILINATGGYKAESAYATLVGLLFDVPVYYIHEAFRETIEMPPTPISWDYSLLADYEEFFEWIDSDLRSTVEVDARLRSVPEDIQLLLTQEGDYSFLSPVGEACYGAYRERLARSANIPVFLSEQARQRYQSADPDHRRFFERILDKLRLRELRANGSGQVGNSDCLVYPKGHRPERVFYYEAENGSVRVCELALKGDQSYDRLIRRGVRRDGYDAFQPWTGPDS